MRIFVPAMVIMGIGVQSTLLSSCCKSCRCCMSPKKTSVQNKTTIKQTYSNVAQDSGCACGKTWCTSPKISQYLGYTDQELGALAGANLGLGCGHPITLGEIRKGDTILDLGSGAGLDCLLVAKKVGPTGKVIGVDVTPAMVKRARHNAKKYGATNVEFKVGDIENLPIADNSIDLIISNCVFNLVDSKDRAFSQAYRVLKTGGRMYVSDLILLKPLSDSVRHQKRFIGTCVPGSELKPAYLKHLTDIGFTIQEVGLDRQANVKKFNDPTLPIASLKYIAHKS